MRYQGWPQEGIDLIEKAAARHGGWQRWEKLQKVSLSLRHLGGPLPFAKGAGKTFPFPSRVEVWPHQKRTLFYEYPAQGQRGVFEAGSVSLHNPQNALQKSPAHRRTFTLLGKYRRWTPLDGLYFFGYALVNYLSLPFLLANLPLLSLPHCAHLGQTLSGVEVEFPEGFDTHSKRQRFFFAEDGLLLRHDYTADVVGSWAKGAHFSEDYTEAGGMPFAMRRRVFVKLFGKATPLLVLEASLGEFAAEFN